MPLAHLPPIVTPTDPRLVGTGRETVAGEDQIPGLLRATSDERLDALVAAVHFIQEARSSLQKAVSDR